MLHIDLAGSTNNLQSVNEAAYTPCPLCICTVVNKLGIETVKIVCTAAILTLASAKTSHLRVAVYLTLAEVHSSDITAAEELTGQAVIGCAYHERERTVTLGIIDGSRYLKSLTVAGNLDDQFVALKRCLDVLLAYHRLLTNLIVLELAHNLGTAFLPVLEFLDLFLAV